MVVVITLSPAPSPNFSIPNTCGNATGGGNEITPNNIKFPTSFELVNNQYIY
jgi:hypothetical protein